MSLPNSRLLFSAGSTLALWGKQYGCRADTARQLRHTTHIRSPNVSRHSLMPDGYHPADSADFMPVSAITWKVLKADNTAPSSECTASAPCIYAIDVFVLSFLKFASDNRPKRHLFRACVDALRANIYPEQLLSKSNPSTYLFRAIAMNTKAMPSNYIYI